MDIYIKLLCIAIGAFLITSILIPFIKKAALKINLVDSPNRRKIHSTPVPLVGGISIGITVFFALSILFSIDSKSVQVFFPIMGCGFTLLIVGAVDDKNDLKAKYKLFIQLLLAFIVAFSGIRIFSFQGLFGIYEIAVWVQYLLTVFYLYLDYNLHLVQKGN